MKKIMKKVALVLSCVMVMGALSGCAKFDASAYLQALLDNSYKNDSAAIVEQGIATAEEAAALYEEGIEAEMASIAGTAGVSDEQADIFKDVIVDMLAGAKYTVGEAEKQDDGSYVVTVTYEQMNIFGPSTETYMTEIEAMVTEWTEAALAGEDVPSEDEMITEMLEVYEEILADTLANVTYAEPQTTTVRIELNDRVYQPNTSDIEQLNYLLYDNDAATE